MPAAYDWSRFTQRIDINASAQDIYNSWAKQEGLERWFLREAVFTTPDNHPIQRNSLVQAGDHYSWRWFGYPDSMTETGTILAANNTSELQFTFAEQCVVTVRIVPENSIQICELVQSNIPTDEEHKIKWHLGCMSGWIFYLANLKSILEGGLDLRNKNISIQKVLNA